MTEPATITLDPVLSVPQTAKLLDLSARTVWRMIEEKKIRAIRISERRTGILASEIKRLQTEALAAA